MVQPRLSERARQALANMRGASPDPVREEEPARPVVYDRSARTATPTRSEPTYDDLALGTPFGFDPSVDPDPTFASPLGFLPEPKPRTQLSDYGIVQFGAGVYGGVQSAVERLGGFQFGGTTNRQDDIIREISDYNPQDVRDMAARKFESRGEGETINDPVILKEMQEQQQAASFLRLVERIEAQPGSTQEAIGEAVGSVLTLGVGEEPLSMEDISRMHPLLQAALVVPSVGAVAGPTASMALTLGRPLASATGRVLTARAATAASRHTEALLPLYAPEVQRWGTRLIRTAGDIDANMAAKAMPATEPLPSAKALGISAIQPGLTRGEQVWNLVRRGIRRPLDHALAAPVIRERLTARFNIQSYANGLAQRYHAGINDAFKINKKNQIEDLAGIDPLLPDAPSIQDVAARLPKFRAHLNDDQVEVLTALKDDLKLYTQAMDEVGIDPGIRPDIMDGGFYIPRGRALEEGTDAALQTTGAGRSGRRGFEQPTKFASMSEGISEGWNYAPVGDVLQSYGQHVGERSLDLHIANYLKTLRDESGKLIAIKPSMLVDPKLRTTVKKLRNKIRGKNKTLIAQIARDNVLMKEVRRLGKRKDLAAEHVESAKRRASDLDSQFIREDLKSAQGEYRISIEQAQGLALRHGENIAHLRTAGVALGKSDRKLAREIVKLEEAIIRGKKSIEEESIARRESTRAYAGGLKRTVGAHMKDANQLTRTVDNLSAGVEKMSSKVDDLMEKGQILKDMRDGERAVLVQARHTERALWQKSMGMAATDRELRIMTRLHKQSERAASKAGKRQENALRRSNQTVIDIQDSQRELDDVSADWDEMISKSRKIPTGYTRIGPDEHVTLEGLENYSFPMELAMSINKVLEAEGATRGQFAKIIGSVNTVNRNVRALNTTFDNSGIGIQGLPVMADNPKAWAAAVKVNFQAWGNHGDRVLGRFLTQFDKNAKDAGRRTSSEWASDGLHIAGGQMGELQMGPTGWAGKLSRQPIFRQANRAFGFFGDSARLEWVDDMLTNELHMGKTIDQLRQNGDLERMAEIANNMTGYSRRRTGGDIGELVLFAPRFLQSRLTTVSRAATGLRPGASLDQRIARRTMLKMVGGAVMMTHLINWMQGRDTDMRPWVKGNPNSNFMRVRFGNRDYSLLGTWDSLAKAFMLTTMGRPQDVWRTLSSPGVRIGWDLMSGKTAIGEQTKSDAEGIPGYLSTETGYYALKAMSPFAMQEVPEAAMSIAEGDILAGVATITGEVFGAKSGPIGFTDTKDIVRREFFPDTPEDELEVWQIRAINSDPRVQEQINKMEDRRGEIDIDDKIRLKFDDVSRAREHNESSLRANINAGMDGPRLRKAISQYKQNIFLVNDLLLGDEEIQEKLNSRKEKQTLKDTLAIAYWTVSVDEDRVTGELNFDKRDEKRAQILQQAEDAGVPLSYITGKNAPVDPKSGERITFRADRYEHDEVRAMVEMLEADREEIREYLEASRNLAEKRGLLELYDEWRGSSDPGFLKANPMLNVVIKASRRLKDNMRKNNLRLERKLWKWGYVSAAQHPVLQGEIRWLRKRQGGQITRRLDIDPQPRGVR